MGNLLVNKSRALNILGSCSFCLLKNNCKEKELEAKVQTRANKPSLPWVSIRKYVTRGTGENISKFVTLGISENRKSGGSPQISKIFSTLYMVLLINPSFHGCQLASLSLEAQVKILASLSL